MLNNLLSLQVMVIIASYGLQWSLPLWVFWLPALIVVVATLLNIVIKGVLLVAAYNVVNKKFKKH